MEEGPYALEIQVVIKAMPSQLRFTKNEAECGGKKTMHKLRHRKNKKGGRVQGREPVER